MVSLPPMPESFLTYTVTNYIILCNYEDTSLVGSKTGSLLLFENDLMCVCVKCWEEGLLALTCVSTTLVDVDSDGDFHSDCEISVATVSPSQHFTHPDD